MGMGGKGSWGWKGRKVRNEGMPDGHVGWRWREEGGKGRSGWGRKDRLGLGGRKGKIWVGRT